LLSKSYAEHGAKLVIHHHDEHSLNEAQEALAKVEALGGQGTLFSGDLTQVKNVESLFQHAQNTFGKIDIAINTVGKVLKKPMADTTEEEFDNMADINTKSAYFFIKYAEKAMNDNGKIITLATALLAAYTGLYATYAGGKSPVEHYTRAASK
ncbi:SDR family oxidoreductase, partial [Staphylococcus hyicus]|uniref:SDR family oxidoreductase n=1 Tax=Staphylococcus hyicus TaxID=1284 RepID=UPI000D413729